MRMRRFSGDVVARRRRRPAKYRRRETLRVRPGFACSKKDERMKTNRNRNPNQNQDYMWNDNTGGLR